MKCCASNPRKQEKAKREENPEENNDEISELGPTASIETERDEYKALAQRAQADLINFRRRMDEERKSFSRQIRQKSA